MHRVHMYWVNRSNDPLLGESTYLVEDSIGVR